MKTPEEIKKGLVEAIEEASWVVEGGDAHDLIDAVEKAHASMADALAYIQQLESALPKWISVEERLPEVSDLVLVIANGKPSPRIILDNACLIASYWGDEGWIADGFYGWDALHVTYWMPLPPSPQEVE